MSAGSWILGETWGQGKGVRLSGSLGLGADTLRLKRVDAQLRGCPHLLENAGCAHMRTCGTHAVHPPPGTALCSVIGPGLVHVEAAEASAPRSHFSRGS